jgi:hypothetical protein
MKALVPFLLLIATCSCTVQSQTDKEASGTVQTARGSDGTTPIEQTGDTKTAKTEIKWNLDFLEKTWAIKVKSTSQQDSKYQPTFKLLLEITKDLDADQIDTLKTALGLSLKGPGTSIDKKGLDFYFFDQDNVVLGKTTARLLEGEITGKKGDAIRIGVDCTLPIANIRKIEARGDEVKK